MLDRVRDLLTTNKAIFIIVILGIVIYFNSLFNGFIGDDFAQIVNNPVVHNISNVFIFFSNSTFGNADSTSTLMGNYYKPILTMVYSLIYTLFHTWTFPYHITQLVLHISNCVLLLLIFKKHVTKEIAFALSIIFLVHPINNEAVVNIASLQEPLFLFFGLLALFSTHQFTDSIIKKILVTTTLLLSLLSKETGIIFIFMFPIYLKLIKHKWYPAIFESAMALFIYLFLRIGVAHIFINSSQVVNYPFAQLSFFQRLLNIPKIMFFYLYTFLYPKDLLIYQRWLVKSLDLKNFYFPLGGDILFILILILYALWIYKHSKESTSIFLFFFTWFIFGIGIHLQIIPLDFTVADRWFYSPMVGLLGMIGIFTKSLQFKKKYFNLLLIPFVFVVVIFSTRDIVRNTNWKDLFTLYTHDLQFEQDNYALQSSLGIELYNRGQLEEAKTHLLSSTQLYSNNQNWTALGFVYVKSKDIPNAEKALIKALGYKKDPVTYQFLVKVMSLYDGPEETKSFVNKYLEYFPNDPVLWLYLSVAEYKLGNKNEAKSDVQNSYNLRPSQESMYVYQKITDNEPINLINNL